MLPPQAAPIDRTPIGAAAFSREAGVDASAWTDFLATPIYIQSPFAAALAGSRAG
jgi:hypothetical protein